MPAKKTTETKSKSTKKTVAKKTVAKKYFLFLDKLYFLNFQ